MTRQKKLRCREEQTIPIQRQFVVLVVAVSRPSSHHETTAVSAAGSRRAARILAVIINAARRLPCQSMPRRRPPQPLASPRGGRSGCTPLRGAVCRGGPCIPGGVRTCDALSDWPPFMWWGSDGGCHGLAASSFAPVPSPPRHGPSPRAPWRRAAGGPPAPNRRTRRLWSFLSGPARGASQLGKTGEGTHRVAATPHLRSRLPEPKWRIWERANKPTESDNVDACMSV